LQAVPKRGSGNPPVSVATILRTHLRKNANKLSEIPMVPIFLGLLGVIIEHAPVFRMKEIDEIN